MAEYVSAVYNFLYKKKDTDSNLELLLGYQGNPFLFNNWNYTKEDINLTAQNITFNCEKFSTSGTGLKIENNEFYKQVNETFQGEENSWASPVYHYTLNTAYTDMNEFYTAAYKEVADGYRDNWMLINNKWVLSSTMSHFTVLELDWDQLRLYSNRYSASGGWSGFYERPLTVNSAIFPVTSTEKGSIDQRLTELEDNMISADVFKADSTGAFFYSNNAWQKIPHNGHKTYVVYQLVAGATSTEGGLYLNCPRITTSNTVNISTFQDWAIGATGYRTPPQGMGYSKIAIIVLEVDTSQEKITYQKLSSGETETMSLKNRSMYANGYWLVKAPQQ